MKKYVFVLLLLAGSSTLMAQELPSVSPRSYEFYQVTTIESVVPAGLGRSRMLIRDENGRQEELKMENFFSAVGINFGNIMSNEAAIGIKIQQLSDQGWELYDTVGGVYSADQSTGIFITRYLFRRIKK
ncbi:MAG: hypothetical protein OHK0053_13530 [Microscillaceae bacterium]